MTDTVELQLYRDHPDMRSDFQKLIGWTVAEWSDGEALIRCRMRRDFLNRGKVAHGGFIATLIDAAAGHACVGPPPTGSGPAEPRGVTLSLTINYLASVDDGELFVRAKRTGGGRSIAFAHVEITDAAGRLIADGSCSYRRFPPKA